MEKPFKRLSLFYIFIFFISIFGVIYHAPEDETGKAVYEGKMPTTVTLKTKTY